MEVWSKGFDEGNSASEAPFAVACDASGSLYTAGMKFSVALEEDLLAMKWDRNGNVLWSRTFDGGKRAYGQGVAVDLSGSVYASGWSHNGANYDMLLVKYDGEGRELWTRSFNGGTHEQAYGVAVDPSGSVYVTGYTQTGTGGNVDVWLTLKYAQDGTLMWSRTFGKHWQYNRADCVVADSSGYVHVAGYCRGIGTYEDPWLLTMDAAGNEVVSMSITVVSGSGIYPGGIAVNASGTVFIAGQAAVTANNDYFIVEATPPAFGMGGLVYYDAGGFDSARGVAADDLGNRYVTGMITNAATGGPDWLTIKYDRFRNIVWTVTYNGGGTDYGNAVVLDPFGDLVVAGQSHVGCCDEVRIVKYHMETYTPGGGGSTGTTDSGGGTAVTVEPGKMKVAPNVMDLSAAGAKVTFHLRGDPGGTAEVRIYSSAQRLMGTLSVQLDSSGAGQADYPKDGVGGRRPGPGSYYAVASGGGVKSTKPFFVVMRR